MSFQLGRFFGHSPNPTPTVPVLSEINTSETNGLQNPKKITKEETLPDALKTSNNRITQVYNTAISQLTVISAQIKQKAISLLSYMHIQWNNTTIQRIFLTAVAGYSLIGARVIAGGIIPATISSFTASIPLVAISGGLLWHAISLIDYQNPTTLNDIRNETQHLPLPEIVKKHGWKNLFHFELLKPSQFAVAYRAYANTLSFNGVLILYKEANNQLNIVKSPQVTSLFTIPAPSEWKQKFLEETKEFSPKEIIEEYAISDLRSFGILTSEQIAPLEKCKELNDQEIAAKETFNKEIDAYLTSEHLKSLHKFAEAKEALDKAGIQERDIRTVRFPTWPLSAKNSKTNLMEFYTNGQLMDRLPNLGEEFKTVLNDGHTKYTASKEKIQAEVNAAAADYNKALNRSAPKKA